MHQLAAVKRGSASASRDYVRKLNALAPVAPEQSWATAVSLFCGGGGLDLGLSFAGVHVSVASDLEAQYCETVRTNLPGTITLPGSVRDLTGSILRSKARSRKIDLLVGGPPCQAFSILGRRGSFEDPRGQLVYEYIRLIRELRPKAFVFENVPGLLTLNGGADWQQLLEAFKAETGYKLQPVLLNSANFGVPQIRKRVFLLGFRGRLPSNFVVTDTHRDPAAITLFDRDVEPWLPCEVALGDVDGLPNHDIRIHGPRVRARYLSTPQGGRDRTDHTDRLECGRPSGTVLVGSKAGGGRPHIHPLEHRVITVREAARLQSFPDWYTFTGSATDQYRQVGNAVPPLMARAVGYALAQVLA